MLIRLEKPRWVRDEESLAGMMFPMPKRDGTENVWVNPEDIVCIRPAYEAINGATIDDVDYCLVTLSRGTDVTTLQIVGSANSVGEMIAGVYMTHSPDA